MTRFLASLVICYWLVTFSCDRKGPTQSDISATVLTAAATRIQVTAPGSRPFHLKAKVVEATNLQNNSYNAEIEEYWAAPDKWWRTVRTQGFSAETIVNGDQRRDSTSGDYYPNWLQTLVTAVFDPGAPVRGLNFTGDVDNPMPLSPLRCRRYSTRVGIPPVENHVFSSVCLDGDKLESIGVPGYNAEYQNYQNFDGKQIPRTIREDIEPGTELEARVTELTELRNVDEAKFTVTQTSSGRLQTTRVREDTLRKMASSPLEMKWPPIRGGKTEGVLSVYVCLDRAGRVRETYALNSDHPEMSDAAQQELSNVTFRPFTIENEASQAEGILTFAYRTVVNDPYPVLTDEEARERVISLPAPKFPRQVPRGSVVTIVLLVDENGKIAEAGPFTGLPKGFGWVPDLEAWQFRPLLRDGKPTAFKAQMKFVVP